MSKLYTEIEPEVNKLCLMVSATRKGIGTTPLSTAWDMITSFIMRMIRLVESTSGYDGAAKKEAVIQAVETFYNDVIKPLDIPGIPNIIEPVFDAILGRAVRPAVDGIIEALVRLFNTIGWPSDDDAPDNDFPLPDPAAA